MVPPHTRGSATGALLLGLTLLVPGPVAAQDFLFQRPGATLSVFGGWTAVRETGDVFDHARTNLTVERGDFDSAPAFFVEAALRVSERVDAAVGLEVGSRSVASEMRDWVTVDDGPIPQTTRFTRTTLSGSAKLYLLRRGRRISRFAWVPARFAPYVGAGAGVGFYEFAQTGDFVDEATLDIFYDEIATGGAGLTAHALAGLQLSLTPRLLLKAEYRQLWGSAGVNGDFADFQDDIDLSGGRALVGLSVRL